MLVKPNKKAYIRHSSPQSFPREASATKLACFIRSKLPTAPTMTTIDSPSIFATLCLLTFASGYLLGSFNGDLRKFWSAPSVESTPSPPVMKKEEDTSKSATASGDVAGRSSHEVIKVIRPLKTRDDVGRLLNEENMTSGIEVGVQQGLFAAATLANWKSCKQYALIDIWMHQENYVDIANVDNAAQNTTYEMAKRNLAPYQNITTFFRMYSTDAAPLIPNTSVDFVYIDARHDYCGAKEDITLFWPKIKPGGIMAGHDYMTAPEVTDGQDWSVCHNGERNPGAVKGAVHDFFGPLGLQVVLTYRESAYNTWLVRKPNIFIS